MIGEDWEESGLNHVDTIQKHNRKRFKFLFNRLFLEGKVMLQKVFFYSNKFEVNWRRFYFIQAKSFVKTHEFFGWMQIRNKKIFYSPSLLCAMPIKARHTMSPSYHSV